MAAFSLTWPQEDIGLLTFDVPNSATNILSLTALEELHDHLQSLSEREGIAGLIIRSGKPGSFAEGIGVPGLSALLSTREEALRIFRRAQQILVQLSKKPFVTVAAIEGSCISGGAELAAWCDRRLFAEHPKTDFGFPEVRIGLIPGWGATVRAPRVVGCAHAVEMICTGKQIDPHTAVRMGWGTAVVSADRLLEAAIDLVREEQRTRSYVTDSERWSQPLPSSAERCSVLPETEQIPAGTARHYPAPAAALELMSVSSGMPLEEALQRETQTLASLFGSPVNLALFNAFHLIDRVKCDYSRNGTIIKSRAVTPMGIIGAGIMGSGIATLAVEAGISVVLSDAVPEALKKGHRQIIDDLCRDPRSDSLDAKRVSDITPLVTATSRDEDFLGSKPGIRSHYRVDPHQMFVVRAIRAADQARRDSGLKHIDDSDHTPGPGTRPSRTFLRNPLP